MAPPVTATLRSLVAELEADASLRDPAESRLRLDALDRLEAYVPGADESGDPDTRAQAEALRSRLEEIDRLSCEAIRDEIRCGSGGEALRRQVLASRDTAAPEPAHGEGYDSLDTLVARVLHFELSDPVVSTLDPEMVPYQPTPARHVFALLDSLQLTAEDTLVDLGSGLGLVPLLTAICTPARAVGIELEAAYIECARRCARELNVERATFVRGDARDADLSQGTVFYLYTPFTGAVLRDMLDALSRQAERRPIRVCAYGPCAAVVVREPWLRPVGAPANAAITVLTSGG